MAQFRPEWEELEPLDREDREILERAERDPNAVTTGSFIRQKLGLFSTCCIILNRKIGSGIFSTPAFILKATGSPGASLLLWGLGAIISYAGLMVYMEFGLSIPRYRTQDGEDKAVPRSGGEKNYLEYVYRTPRYLTTCVFGIVFIVLGNTAGNAIAFAKHVLLAQEDKNNQEAESDPWRTKGIGVCAITGACLLHGSWRAGGIWLNNFCATVKVLILVVFIITGFVYSAGGGGDRSTHTLDLNCSFVYNSTNSTSGPCSVGIYADTSEQIYGFLQSLLMIIFAFGGFENANYVLGEIDRPKRNYKWATLLSFGLAVFLYMLMNIAYFLVLPTSEFEAQGIELAVIYFEKIMPDNPAVRKAVASFVAFSSFGNIIVVTFVSSRVKQEIAKEGILPFSWIFASEMRTPFSQLRNKLFGSATGHGYSNESTPVAALFLHWVFCLILILSPSATDGYLFNVLLHSYAIHVWVGFFLAVGLLYLYFKHGSDWKRKREFKPIGSWMWALFYAMANAFLICVAWVPPPQMFKTLLLKDTGLYVYPTVVVSLVVSGAIYWVGFAQIYPRYSHRVLNVKRHPIVQGGVQVYEAIFFNWVVPGALDSDHDLQELNS